MPKTKTVKIDAEAVEKFIASAIKGISSGPYIAEERNLYVGDLPGRGKFLVKVEVTRDDFETDDAECDKPLMTYA